MIFRLPTWLLFGLLLADSAGTSAAQEPAAMRTYLIGNSLTWDTMPGLLTGDVQWHVDCGTNLPFIHTHPEKPCVKTSTLWPTALRDKQYDFVSVQPHYGSTLVQDVKAISSWMALQPKAVFVLHTGWARHAQHIDEFNGYAAPDAMAHSPNYIRALLAELRKLHPGREVRPTMAQYLLAKISEDIAAKQAPFAALSDLFRDDIHMKQESGRYLMHNAMRHALGQPFSKVGFEKMDSTVQQYLDSTLALLLTTDADKALLKQILALDSGGDRAPLIAKLADPNLRSKMSALLPEIERAVHWRRSAAKVEANVKAAGGRLVHVPTGPAWLYLVLGDVGLEIFDVLASIDLYNGNNPLKKQGERNETVTDDWLQCLAGVATLRRLDLANCAVRGAGLRHLSALKNLRELNLTLSPVQDDALEHVAAFPELRMLGLASTQCNGTGFVHLKALQKLENVNFHFTPLNDAGLRAISQVPISGRFWFAHTKFTDAGAASLSAMKQLRRCGIGSADKASSGEAVAALTEIKLEDLTLLDKQATPAGIAHAAKIATLRRLEVSHGPTVGDDSLKLIALMPLLEEFKIGSAQLTDDGLQALAASKSLKKITLSGVKKVTVAGLDRLRRARPDLILEAK